MFYKFLLFFLFSNLLLASNLPKIKIYTEEYPPYNMLKNGKITGFSVELLNKMFKTGHFNQSLKDIKLVPWARGFRIVSKKKNTMLFSTVRNKKRENMFKWVGPIVAEDQELISLKNLNIKSFNDLKAYKVGGVLGWSVIDDLKAHNVKVKLYSGKNAVLKGFQDLLSGKIDIFAFNKRSIKYDKSLHNFNPNDFKIVFVVSRDDLYYAFNKKTSDDVIQAYQKALNKVKSTNFYQKLLIKYKIK